MPLQLSDVKSPAGAVDGSVWFPALTSGEVDTLLTGYIEDAEDQSDDSDAQEQWVYYRAATAVADRLAGGSGSTKTLTFVDAGAKTVAVAPTQPDYWLAKAAAYLAAFEELEADVTNDPLGGFLPLTSLRHG